MKSIANGLLAPLAYIDTVIHAINGEKVDLTSYMQQYGQKASEYGDMALQNTSGIGRFAAEVALSIGQNLPMLAVGPAGLLWMGLSAAGIDAAQQNLAGKTAWESMGHATAMGLVEVLTEKLPFDELLKLKDVKSFTGFLAKAGKAAALDFNGEAIAAAAQNFLDIVISGEDSRYWQRVNELKAGNNLSLDQAITTARFELFIFEPLYSGAQGALSSIAMGAILTGVKQAGRAASYLKGKLSGKVPDWVQDMAEHYAQFPISPETLQMEAQQKVKQLQAAPELQQLTAPPQQPMLTAAPKQLMLAEGQTTTEGNTTPPQMTPAQVEQEVSSRIQNNASSNAKNVDIAVIDSMTTLDNIETRVKAQSRNVSHEGIGIDAIHDMYMDYLQNKVALADIAYPMAGAIKTVMSTQTLTASENVRLKNALAGIIGDVGLAEAYVDGSNPSMEELNYNANESAAVQSVDTDGEAGYNTNSGTEGSGSKKDIPNGVDVDSRVIDETKDATLIRRVRELRSVFTGKYVRGNFGYAEVNIDGLETNELYAHSKIESYEKVENKKFAQQVQHIAKEFSEDESIFKPLWVNKDLVVNGADAWLRNVDTEAKIIETLARLLGIEDSLLIQKNYARGFVKLYTELPPCPSCRWVIEQFNEVFPNIKLK